MTIFAFVLDKYGLPRGRNPVTGSHEVCLKVS